MAAVGLAELLLLLMLGGAPAGSQLLYSNPLLLLGSSVAARAVPVGAMWLGTSSAVTMSGPVGVAVPPPLPPPVSVQPARP